MYRWSVQLGSPPVARLVPPKGAHHLCIETASWLTVWFEIKTSTNPKWQNKKGVQLGSKGVLATDNPEAEKEPNAS